MVASEVNYALENKKKSFEQKIVNVGQTQKKIRRFVKQL
jgi:hypothetical protein